MTRSEEILLAFVSGLLLAFGISEVMKSPPRNGSLGQGMRQDSKQINQYWRNVGGYIRQAQANDGRRKASTTARG
jgi:hypothetical protein